MVTQSFSAICIDRARFLGENAIPWERRVLGPRKRRLQIDAKSTQLNAQVDSIPYIWPFPGEFACQGKPKPRIPDQVWIDSGYMAPVVYTLCREAGRRFHPAVGRGGPGSSERSGTIVRRKPAPSCSRSAKAFI